MSVSKMGLFEIILGKAWIYFAQQGTDLERPIFTHTKATETDSLLSGKTDSGQGKNKSTQPTDLGAPRIGTDVIPREGGGDGASDEGALEPKISSIFFLRLIEESQGSLLHTLIPT